jgi:dihydropteroate synthase
MQKEFRPGLFNQKYSIRLKNVIMDLSVPKVMAVINLTPDSFYHGSRVSDLQVLERLVSQFLEDGADILDIGAYSSRPGALQIEEKEEMKRLEPALNLLNKKFPDAIVSLDTFRSGIAEIAIKSFGVAMINDISAGRMDEKMLPTVAELQVPYIMMHMQGTPQNMQENPQYKNLMKEIISFFAQRIHAARDFGIKDIIIDPGFGFGKRLDHNYHLLQNLELFKVIDYPLLVGLSRKSMIYRVLNISPDESLTGTVALNAIALKNGANILRVHDVKETVQIVKLFNKLMDFPIE